MCTWSAMLADFLAGRQSVKYYRTFSFGDILNKDISGSISSVSKSMCGHLTVIWSCPHRPNAIDVVLLTDQFYQLWAWVHQISILIGRFLDAGEVDMFEIFSVTPIDRAFDTLYGTTVQHIFFRYIIRSVVQMWRGGRLIWHVYLQVWVRLCACWRAKGAQHCARKQRKVRAESLSILNIRVFSIVAR